MNDVTDEYTRIANALKKLELSDKKHNETLEHLATRKQDDLSKAQQRYTNAVEQINRKLSVIRANREKGQSILQSVKLDGPNQKFSVDGITQAATAEQGFESGVKRSTEAISSLGNTQQELIRVRDAIRRARQMRQRIIIGGIVSIITVIFSIVGFTAYRINQEQIANATATGVYIANATGTVERAFLNITAAAANATSTANAINLQQSINAAQNRSTAEAVERQATIAAGGLITINASEFDTYGSGYRISVTQYEIDFTQNRVRVYFEATAQSSDLRSPTGTYLTTNSGNVNPLSSSNWSSSGATFYSGYFDFDATYFRNQSGLRLIYCGCGFYDIGLRDLRSYFN